MPSILLIDSELDGFTGLPHIAITLYLMLRRRMDLRTGIVGAPHLVSWQALAEDLYEEYRPGQRRRSLTRWALLRAAHWLERSGLVEMRSNRDQRHLVFKLLKARLLPFAQNQTAPIPHVIPHDPAHRDNPQNPARPPMPNPALHRLKAFANPAAFTDVPSATRRDNGKPVWQPTYPQGYPAADRAEILQLITKNQLDSGTAQLLLDELVHREGKTLVRRRVGLFATMVTQLKRGTFYGKGAEMQRQGGAPLTDEELRMVEEGGRP